MSDSLLKQPPTTDPNKSRTLDHEFVNFFELLLVYQMRSICAYYRNKFFEFLRELADWDDWQNELKGILDAESTLNERMGQYVGVEVLSILQEVREKGRVEVRRLTVQELQQLFVVNPRDEIEDIERRKEKLIEGTWEWVSTRPEFSGFCSNSDNSRLLWITGTTGVGKTFLVIAIIRYLETLREKAGRPPTSYFFIQGSFTKYNSPTAALRGLIWMLLQGQPWLMCHYREALDPTGRQIFDDTETSFFTLKNMFKKIMRDPRVSRTYFLLDAVDEVHECDVDSKRHQGELLDLIQWSLSNNKDVKWLVSSEGDPDTEFQLSGCTGFTKLDLDRESKTMHDSVHIYIKKRFDILAAKRQCDLNQWAQDLEGKADGNFLMASSMFDQLKSRPTVDFKGILEEAPLGLDELYAKTMKKIDGLAGSYPRHCKRLLAILAIAEEPIHTDELLHLMDLPASDLEQVVGHCLAFLSVGGGKIGRKNKSAHKYMMAKGVQDRIFPPGGEDEMHSSIVSKLLQSMSSILRRDIYNLGDPGIMIEEIHTPNPDPLIPISYACLHWIDHVTKISSDAHLYNERVIDSFLKVDFLHWLEALSLMKSAPNGIHRLKKLEEPIQQHIRDAQDPEVSADETPSKAKDTLCLLRDAYEFTTYNRTLIENTPLQLYVSALTFCPLQSKMRMWYEGQMRFWIRSPPQVETSWPLFLNMRMRHTKEVKSLAYSPDGTELASASVDHTIRIWDTEDGSNVRVLQGHTDTVNSVAYSPDSKWIVSASGDRSVGVWDAETGRLVQRLHHYCFVNSAAISFDSKWVVTGSSDGSVQIWNRANGKWKRNLLGSGTHSSNSVAISKTELIVSASSDGRIRMWEVSGSYLGSFDDHNDAVNSVAFSPDSSQIITASADSTVRTWDTKTLSRLLIYRGHKGFVNAASFSPNSRWAASAGEDPRGHPVVRLWNAANGEDIRELSGPCDSISAVSFCDDSVHLAAGADDSSIMIWDTSTGQLAKEIEGRTSPVCSIEFSRDVRSKYFAIASANSVVQVWRTRTGKSKQTFQGHKDAVKSVSFSYDGKSLASGSADRTVRVWDLITDKEPWISQKHDGPVNMVTFSPNDRWLASASDDRLVRVWNIQESDPLPMKLSGHTREANCIAFSPDSRWIASGSTDHTIFVWDLAVDPPTRLHLKGHRGRVDAVAFRDDSDELVSASYDLHIHLWNSKTGHIRHKIYIGTRLNCQPFSVRDSHLYTELGTIDLKRSIDDEKPRWLGYSVSRNRERIKRNEKNVFWLPFEYQPVTSAVSWNRSTVVIGCPSGKVLVIGFDPYVQPYA